MKKLSNKTLAVLALLRRDGGEHTCKDIAATIMAETPCGTCDGTGEANDGGYCRRCHGRGLAHFDYSAAYIALQKLMRERLVRRRYIVDEWGDETTSLVYEAVEWRPQQAGDDELEAAFQAPSAVKP